MPRPSTWGPIDLLRLTRHVSLRASMAPKTVMTIFGTRPEAIKLAPLLLEMRRAELQLHPFVCVTGQHREMLHPILDWFDVRPDRDLNLMQTNQTLAGFAGRVLGALSTVLETNRPDAILVQGDTTTAMMGALAGFYHRIPVAHVEAGLRTGDFHNPFPEEVNRRMAGLTATYHFAPTETAATALLSEGVDARNVFTVGNTVLDALRITLNRKQDTKAPFASDGRRLIVVTAHRRESFGSPFESICLAIRELIDRNENTEVVYPVHLNPNVRDPVGRHLRNHPRIHLIEPLRYEEFVLLMSRCYLILTDSGGIQEEATALGKPTLIMRNTTERPEAIASGTAKLVGTDAKQIVASAEQLLGDENAYRAMANRKCPFGDGHSAQRIIDVLRQVL